MNDPILFDTIADLIQDGDEPQQQAVAAHQLPDARHPAGLAHLHRAVQGLRQAHEPHPLRLRGVQGRSDHQSHLRLANNAT